MTEPSADNPDNTPPGTSPAADPDGRMPEPAPVAPDPAETLRVERDALQDRLLRVAAEFDNYRKRVDRERRELAESAAEGLLVELLPIVDDMERALATPAVGEASAYRAGVELIHRQMLDLLRKRGVTLIDTTDRDFDPRVHQAVSQEPSANHRDGQVMEELRRGYMLGDRLLRPAMVKVAAS
jgi:molecular chaperone GrpE